MHIKLTNSLNESIRENLIIDLIKESIKGTEWENNVFLAGGVVRDELMNVPIKDIDLMVNTPNGGILFAKWMTQKYNLHQPIMFPTFGTAKFDLKNIIYKGNDLSGIDIECVMSRGEKYTSGSRKPEVYFCGLKSDIERRDATINSLIKNISTGEILDLTGKGISDLKAGVMRTPLDPDVTFSDDPLRMLRFCRQSMKYDFDIPLYILRSMKRNASQLENISNERIRDELDKMLVTGSPDRAIKLLRITGLLDYIIPEFKTAYKMTQNAHHYETVFNHILTVLKNTKPNLVTRLQALFHDIGKTTTRSVINNEVHFYNHENVSSDMARVIMSRLKYPNDIIDAVAIGVRNHMRLKQAGKEGDKMSDKTIRKFIVDLGDHLDTTLDLMHSDNLAHSPESRMPNQIPNIIKRIEILKNTTPKKNEKLPVTGEDLIKLGLRPGPLFSKLLELVKDKQLENPNTSKEEYLELIKNYLQNV